MFSKYGDRVPVAFLRALSYKESRQNPLSHDGPAYGLLQVLPLVLADYNKRYSTQYVPADLLRPEVNVAVGADLLNRTIALYGSHPDANMRGDFRNPEFVKLLVAGWNSGPYGVRKVADYLRARGLPVTHDNVFAHAAAAGATVHLQNPAKQRWQREVAALYFLQPDATGGVGDFLGKVAVAAVVALLAFKFIFK